MELRLQAPDELGPHFTLDEKDSEAYRRQFEQDRPDKVRELREDEEKRRERNAAKHAKQVAEESDQLESWKKRTSPLEIPWGISLDLSSFGKGETKRTKALRQDYPLAAIATNML